MNTSLLRRHPGASPARPRHTTALMRRARLWALAALTGAASLGALAQPSPQFTVVAEYPAGIACTFPLRIESDGTGHRVVREFFDRNGQLVRMIDNGTGPDLRLTNVYTGANLTLQGNGANILTRPQSDGSVQVRMTGHVILILFPSDVPPGPSTTLYVGQLNYAVDAAGVFSLGATSGRKADLCAELS